MLICARHITRSIFATHRVYTSSTVFIKVKFYPKCLLTYVVWGLMFFCSLQWIYSDFNFFCLHEYKTATITALICILYITNKREYIFNWLSIEFFLPWISLALHNFVTPEHLMSLSYCILYIQYNPYITATARAKPSGSQEPEASSRPPPYWTSLCCFPKCMNRELDQKRSSPDSRQCPAENWVLTPATPQPQLLVILPVSYWETKIQALCGRGQGGFPGGLPLLSSSWLPSVSLSVFCRTLVRLD